MAYDPIFIEVLAAAIKLVSDKNGVNLCSYTCSVEHCQLSCWTEWKVQIHTPLLQTSFFLTSLITWSPSSGKDHWNITIRYLILNSAYLNIELVRLWPTATMTLKSYIMNFSFLFPHRTALEQNLRCTRRRSVSGIKRQWWGTKYLSSEM